MQALACPREFIILKADANSHFIQQAYKTFPARLFALTGIDTPPLKMPTLFKIDKQLAASHRTNVKLRDVNANYNNMLVAALAKR